MPRVAPFGSWRSPITADVVAGEAVTLFEVMVDGDDLYWSELRPAEGGRKVIVRRRADGRTEDVIPPGFNARTRVHEYGGGDFLVVDGSVYFSNFTDQRLYRVDPGAAPEPFSPPGPYRYADGVLDRPRRRIITVREDHAPGEQTAHNALVALPLGDGPVQVLAKGADFYAAPRLSPDGTQLAWLSWNHPNMPWDGTELWVARLRADGRLDAPQRVAGRPEESVYRQKAGDFSLAPWRIVLHELASTAIPRPFTPGYREYENILQQALRDIQLGADVKTTLDAAAARIDRELAKYRP